MPRLTQEFKTALLSTLDAMHKSVMQNLRIEPNLGQVVSAQFRFPDPLVVRFMWRRCQNVIGCPNSSDAEVQAEQDASMAEFESQSTSKMIQTYGGKYHEKFAGILITTLRELDVLCPGFIVTLAACSQQELMELMAPDTVGNVTGWPIHVRMAAKWHREWCDSERSNGLDNFCDHRHVPVVMFLRAALHYMTHLVPRGLSMSSRPDPDWKEEVERFVAAKIKEMRMDDYELLYVQLDKLTPVDLDDAFLKYFS